MKTLGYLVLGLFVLLALPACNTAEKYAANNAAATQWLNANAGKALIDIGGRWHVEELVQKSNRITGSIGEYTANGVIKGRTVYIALSSDGWVFYTVIVKPTATGALEGFYSGEVPYSLGDERMITLKRSNL
jgi:hypothetical protein